MRLTLMRDGDKGNPLGEANTSDAYDASEFQDALGEIQEQAEQILSAEAEERAERQKALAVPAEGAEPTAAEEAAPEPPKGAKSSSKS